MNFYDTKNRPSNADYLAEIEQAEKRRTPEERERRAEAEEKRRLRNAGARIELSCSQAQHEKIKFIIWQVPIVDSTVVSSRNVSHVD